MDLYSPHVKQTILNQVAIMTAMLEKCENEETKILLNDALKSSMQFLNDAIFER